MKETKAKTGQRQIGKANSPMANKAKIGVFVSNFRLMPAAANLFGFLVSVGLLAAAPALAGQVTSWPANALYSVRGEGDSGIGDALSTGSFQIASEETQPDGSREKMRKKKASEGSQPETNENFLRGEELENLFPDTEISHVNPNSGSNVLMLFRADGTLTGTSRSSKSGEVRPVSGDWFVTGKGTLCFSSDQQGRLCFFLVRRGDRQLIRYGRNKQLMPGIDWTIVKLGPRAHLVLDTR